MTDEWERLSALRDELAMRSLGAQARPSPAWIDGRPTGPGIWVLRMRNRDLVTATVERDTYEYDNGAIETYLRIADGETSEELDRADGEIGRWVARSFGPIPDPEVT